MKMHVPLLVAGVLSLCAFAVQAQSAPESAAVAGQADAAKVATSQDNDPNCLRYTGSVIVAHENQKNARAPADAKQATPKCNGSVGRSYTQDDIRRTGANNVADALRQLDPAVH